jgi:hypothetical protein
VFVQSNGQISGAVIIEVLATTTSFLPGSPVNVTGGSTTTGADIYVPPPAGELNASLIGVGDAGSPISYGGTGVEVARGQTRQLLLGGTGLSSANGTTVAISGDGITLGPTQFQSGFVFVNITVAASATTGARNVIVTNSNLDRSILSGGLIVR